MNQIIPKEISEAGARMFGPYVPGLTAEKIEERLRYIPEPGLERLLRRSEAAAAMAISLPTLDRMLRAGQLPKRRIRGAVRIPASAVEAIVNGKEVE